LSITLFRDGTREYFRITRAWGGKEHQDYVRIENDNDRDRAYAKAQEIDDKLKTGQTAYFLRQQISEERYFHEDGKIVGLSKVLNRRKGRSPAWEFKLRIKIPNEKRPRFTTISIDRHGVDKAFSLAIDKICEWNSLDKHSEIRKSLLLAREHYTGQVDEKVLIEKQNLAALQAKKEIGTVEAKLKKDIEKFLEQQSDSTATT